MITFFRRIRQKLITENKITRYLLYAIGEIALVVIGILIALQVNNWNEAKKDRQSEKLYLEALQTEFSNNLDILDETIHLNEVLVAQLGELLTFFDKKKLDTTSTKDIATYIGIALRYEILYSPSTGVLTDITSSGNLKLITNNDLRQDIAAFGNTLKVLNRQELATIENRNNMSSYTKENISLRAVFKALSNTAPENSKFEESNIKALFDLVVFENDLTLYQEMSQTTGNVYYTSLKKDIEHILNLISTELNNIK